MTIKVTASRTLTFPDTKKDPIDIIISNIVGKIKFINILSVIATFFLSSGLVIKILLSSNVFPSSSTLLYAFFIGPKSLTPPIPIRRTKTKLKIA